MMMAAYATMTAIGALSAAAFAEAMTNPAQISQMNRRFTPDAVILSERSALRILNDDRFIHHVYYETGSKKFDSGDQRPGETVDLSFAGAGVYHIRCAIHPKMKLTVTIGVAPEDQPVAK